MRNRFVELCHQKFSHGKFESLGHTLRTLTTCIANILTSFKVSNRVSKSYRQEQEPYFYLPCKENVFSRLHQYVDIVILLFFNK